MKKNTVNAFTLVEMLIVIVIIGILIAALMPRMQAAQWRARDVSRKTALSQVQSAIVTSQWDKWKWPWVCDASRTTDCATGWIGLSAISWDLTRAWMNSVPVDPLKSKITWIWSFMWNTGGDYAYIVTKRNWTEKGWFALMAKTEVEWWSNRVYCGSWNDSAAWIITWGTDVAKIKLCETITGGNSDSICANDYNGNCQYKTDSQLRYLVIY